MTTLGAILELIASDKGSKTDRMACFAPCRSRVLIPTFSDYEAKGSTQGNLGRTKDGPKSFVTIRRRGDNARCQIFNHNSNRQEMDQLADQASDLRSFLNNPATSPVSSAAVGAGYSPSPGAAGPLHRAQSLSHQHPPPPAHSPGSAYGDNSAHQPHDSRSESTKRKSEDDDASAKQQRSKRNRVRCNPFHVFSS